MLSDMWKQASSPNGSTTNTKILQSVLGDGGQLVPVRSPSAIAAAYGKRGIVISRGSAAFDLVEVGPATVALVGYDDADVLLRVEERLVLRVLDDRASLDIAL
jgi:hypothetical protein